MTPEQFSAIQSKFKGFLNEKLHPNERAKASENRPEPPPLPTFKVEKIEETTAFGMGNDNDPVGYRITYIDKDGNKKTKLSPTPGL